MGPAHHEQNSPLWQGSACRDCSKPLDVCVCARLDVFSTRLNVLILQHPQEQDFLLGSARLLEMSLNRARRVVGLSWGALHDAWGDSAAPGQWAVLYPSSLPRELTPAEERAPWVLMGGRGQPLQAAQCCGLVVLDGTWSQAKALWWRNPWLLRLGRMLVRPQSPSIYGKLRKEPRRNYVSTLEAVGASLTALGEDGSVEAGMRRAFRTMVQRVRDHHKKY
jgi:DTW domain-containing protein YfiP